MIRRDENFDICNRLAEIFARKPEVLLVFLFGSVAAGNMTDQSDMDIAILFDRAPDAFKIHRLVSELSDVFPREIDMAVLNTASPILGMQVLKNGQLAFARNEMALPEFYINTLNSYEDLKQIRKITEDQILKGRLYAR